LPTGDQRRVVLLTGAGGLLGNVFCQAYYQRYDIVAVCRERVPAVPSQEEWFIDPLAPRDPVPENASPVFVVRADLSRAGEVERVVDLALARFGAVDLLVNNAAYWRHTPNGLVDGDTALEQFEPHFALNVGVPLRLSTRLAQRCWLHADAENRARNRNIVNVSSLSGSRVYSGGQALYAASKAALDQLTRHQAAEFAEFGVRVNAVAPAAFPADVPTQRVAAAIAELDGAAMTGDVFGVGIPESDTAAAGDKGHQT
jgi:NAD(P)-dependent dehydrogenase (short-subunit alcohol dehydrogenase family)